MLSQIKRLYFFVTCTVAISLLVGCGGVTNEPVPKALLAENVLFSSALVSTTTQVATLDLQPSTLFKPVSLLI